MRTLADALRRTGQLRLLLALWALTAGPAALFAFPLERQASVLLDARLAAEPMLRSDDGLSAELLVRHGPSLLPAALAALVAGLLVQRLLAWIAAGGVLAALDGAGRGARELLAETGRRAPAMLRVGLVGLAVELMLLGGAGALVALLVDEPRPRALLLAAVAALLLVGLAHLVTDCARALAVETSLDRSAWRLVGRGFVVVWRGRATAATLLLFDAAGWLLPTLIYVAAAVPVDPWPTHGFAVLLLLRHLTILLRCWLGAAGLAAAAALVQRQGRAEAELSSEI